MSQEVKFPSPRGDKLLFRYADSQELWYHKFPSPRGDKLLSQK